MEITLKHIKDQFYHILADGQEVGACTIDTEDITGGFGAYIERIDIDEKHRNRGIGTKALEEIAYIYGGIYFAPDNEDAKRLYERIAEEFYSQESNHHGYYVDQGFGVYMM